MVEVVGYAAHTTHTNDSRICISSRAIFWTKSKFINTYLHEVTHRLIFDFEKILGKELDGHGPVFFLVLTALCKRHDQSTATNCTIFHLLNLYDFEDRPVEFKDADEALWRAHVLEFALGHADDLAKSKCPAEQLAKQANLLWKEYIHYQQEIDLETTKNLTQKASELQTLKANLSSMKTANFYSWLLAFAGWTLTSFFIVHHFF